MVCNCMHTEVFHLLIEVKIMGVCTMGGINLIKYLPWNGDKNKQIVGEN